VASNARPAAGTPSAVAGSQSWVRPPSPPPIATPR
jgi:hypothetical protein